MVIGSDLINCILPANRTPKITIVELPFIQMPEHTSIVCIPPMKTCKEGGSE